MGLGSSACVFEGMNVCGCGHDFLSCYLFLCVASFFVIIFCWSLTGVIVAQGDLDTFVHDYRKAKLYTVLRKVALFEKVSKRDPNV